jgi:hypothetical protein
VARLKSAVAAADVSRISSGVPQARQNQRSPLSLDDARPMDARPCSTTKASAGTEAKAMAGLPELSWQVRQWHQPASVGALASR